MVIGETPESMIAQGFKPVGKDFPVFINRHFVKCYNTGSANIIRGHYPKHSGILLKIIPIVVFFSSLSL